MQDKRVMEYRTNSRELHLISCGYEKCEPESSYGPTVRRYYTLHFVLSGQGDFYIQNKHYVINENQYFLIAPDVLTFYKADRENPWTYVWICFHGDAASVMLEHCRISSACPVQRFSYVEDIKETIFQMMKHPELTPANECYIQSGLYAIFARMQESANASYNDVESNDNIYITQAMDYILSNSASDVTVMDVANYLHISRSYLFSLFKKHLNTSPQRFLTMSRISNARELLARTDIPIAVIADSCGYQNPFAFSRVFKKEMGLTPTEYRQEYREVEEIVHY